MKRVLLLFVLLLCATLAIGQVVVRGTVRDAETGETLPMTTVLIRGTSTGVTSDANGAYSVTVPDGSAELEFVYTGYKSQVVVVGSRTQIDVALEPDSKLIEQVVVTAYGKAKKSSLVGASTEVVSKEFEARPITSATQAINGLVAGVQMTSGGGQPGESSEIRIRGVGSYSASTSPLVVVDGAIYEGRFSDINPNDVASISLLKDAASSAIYGSSAGNGVLLITTKQAQQRDGGPAKVTFFGSWGISERGVPEYDLIGEKDYYPTVWLLRYNALALDPSLADEDRRQMASQQVYKLLKYNPYAGVKGHEIVDPATGKLNSKITGLLWGDDLDWISHIEQRGFRQEYGLNLSYGNERLRSYTSLGYIKSNGFSLNTNFERYSLRVNASYDVRKWLTIGTQSQLLRTNIAGLFTDGNASYGNPFMFIRQMGPIYPVHAHNADGSYVLDADGQKIYDILGPRPKAAMPGRHIVAETLWNKDMSVRNAMDSRSFLELNLPVGFKVSTNFSYGIRSGEQKQFTNAKVGDAKGKGRLDYTNTRRIFYSFNQLVDWTYTFDEVHNVSALLGHEFNAYFRASNDAQRVGMVLPDLYEMDNFREMEDISSSSRSRAKEGYFARASYDFANRYYLSASYRRDGSSRFAPGRKWGDFWSVGAAWRIEQEAFLRDVRWINLLKLRVSHGLTGVDDLDSYYPWMTTISPGSNNYNEEGVLVGRNGNKELSWETQVMTDVALEFSFWNRLRGTVEFFNKVSSDLLFDFPLPPSSGYTTVEANVGQIRNYGLEVELSATALQMGGFRWQVGGNATVLRNVVDKLPVEEIISGTKRLSVGHSIYDFWLRSWTGVDPETGEPTWRFDGKKNKFSERRGDVVRGPGDTITYSPGRAQYAYHGSAFPKVYGGFNTQLSWRGVELGMVLTWQFGGKFYDGAYASLMNTESYGSALHADLLTETWTPERRNAKYPQLNAEYAEASSYSSDNFLVSSNSVAIRSVTLSYTLPKSWYATWGVGSVRLALAGENLWFSAARRGMNPQGSYNGVSSNTYSTARTYTGTVTINF